MSTSRSRFVHSFSLRDVVAVDATRFYATSYYHFQHPRLRMMEDLFGMLVHRIH